MNAPVVVVGSGLAGLVAAWSITGPCLLVTPGRLTQGAASMLAQGGIAAAVGPDDSVELHAHDTWIAGDRAGDPEMIARVTGAGPGAMEELRSVGVAFDTTPTGELDLHLEAGHSRRRIAPVRDTSGSAITSAVARAVAKGPVEVLEHTQVVDLLVESAGHDDTADGNTTGRVTGVLIEDASGRRAIDAAAVVLATGGHGGLWRHATSSPHAVGAGVAMAARAGVRTDDLHLMQFHPTALDAGGAGPMPLLTEALRGAGAVLLADGRRFVDELRPRDQVAAAVWEQLQAGRRDARDARGVERVVEHFPQVNDLCRQVGLDPSRDLLPTRPAAHYAMGGITVDRRGRTSLPGLWAVGEVARTGLHGANRLASNSLLEAFVTGRDAASDIACWTCDERARSGQGWSEVPSADPATVVARGPGSIMDLTEVQETLEAGCGVLRDASGIRATIERLAPMVASDDAAYVAWLVARAALDHRNSRGAHRRVDDPSLATKGATA